MRKVAVSLMAAVVLCGGLGAKSLPRADKKLWVGQFDQCSYNAVSSVLVHFYGPVPAYHNRTKFEQKTFYNPLSAAGFAPYFGWAPWTSYMVDSGKMKWRGKPVRNLVGRRFSLATRNLPKVLNFQQIQVRYAPGERRRLVRRLRRKLRKGPVVIWSPYAAELNRQDAWRSVKRVSHNVDIVPFNPGLTHAVTIFARPGHKKVLVTDCSVMNGWFTARVRTVVSVAAAMSASIRIRFGNHRSIFQRGLAGIKHDRFETVFYRKHAGRRKFHPVLEKKGQ